MAETARGEEKESSIIEEISSSATDETAIENYPAQEAIAGRAYEIYMARGDAHGSALDDWLQAEQELIAKSETVQDISE